MVHCKAFTGEQAYITCCNAVVGTILKRSTVDWSMAIHHSFNRSSWISLKGVAVRSIGSGSRSEEWI